MLVELVHVVLEAKGLLLRFLDAHQRLLHHGGTVFGLVPGLGGHFRRGGSVAGHLLYGGVHLIHGGGRFGKALRRLRGRHVRAADVGRELGGRRGDDVHHFRELVGRALHAVAPGELGMPGRLFGAFRGGPGLFGRLESLPGLGLALAEQTPDAVHHVPHAAGHDADLIAAPRRLIQGRAGLGGKIQIAARRLLHHTGADAQRPRDAARHDEDDGRHQQGQAHGQHDDERTQRVYPGQCFRFVELDAAVPVFAGHEAEIKDLGVAVGRGEFDAPGFLALHGLELFGSGIVATELRRVAVQDDFAGGAVHIGPALVAGLDASQQQL